MRVSGAVTANAVLQLGGPAMLAEWLYRGGHDGATALRACARADWLVWLAAVDGASDAQLLGAGIAAVGATLPLGVVAVLRHLRALVPTVRPLLERVDVSTGAG